MKPKQTILVIRNDKLGDFMLAWPALALLRVSLPQAHIAVLVPPYTEPMAEACSYIDEIIVDLKHRGDLRNGLTLAKILKPKKFDAVITLFSRFDTGLAAWSARIPYRLAPATKLAQVFYNHRLKQRRSKSAKPEYEYNLDLAKIFLRDHHSNDAPLPAPPYLHFDEGEINGLELRFRQEHGIPAARELIFVHAGHGGSASNLSLAQYAELIHHLHSGAGHHVILTTGPDEEPQIRVLSGLLPRVPHNVYISRDGLVNFAMHLQFCDVFISGSTGPLHIAGALNCRTAAFYPRRRSSTALRWQTINTPDRRLAFEPPAGSDGSDMQAIDMTLAAAKISEQFLQ